MKKRSLTATNPQRIITESLQFCIMQNWNPIAAISNKQAPSSKSGGGLGRDQTDNRPIPSYKGLGATQSGNNIKPNK